MLLLNLLLQIVKGRIVKELPQGDVQAVAQLLDGGYGDAVIAPTDNVVESGLRHAAEGSQAIDRDLLLGAELQNPGAHRNMAVDTASHPNAKGLA